MLNMKYCFYGPILMNGFYLMPTQLAELRIAHKSESYKRSAYKINAIILLGTGWKLKEVKEALLLDEETLRDYVKRYQSGGIEELISTHYHGSESRLTIEESQALCTE
jgi:transposase